MYPFSDREGCVVASGSTFSNDDKWGVLKGVRAGDSPATYFRTAVHEVGHAMGLDHNETTTVFAIMRPTNGIAETATPAAPFPTNIQWSFTRDDEHRLRHWPDLVVRPGGLKGNAGWMGPVHPDRVGRTSTGGLDCRGHCPNGLARTRRSRPDQCERSTGTCPGQREPDIRRRARPRRRFVRHGTNVLAAHARRRGREGQSRARNAGQRFADPLFGRPGRPLSSSWALSHWRQCMLAARRQDNT